jgi:general secretion pathway protein D
MALPRILGRLLARCSASRAVFCCSWPAAVLAGMLLAAPANAADSTEGEPAAAEQLPPDVIAAKLSAEVAARQLEAKRLTESDPLAALELLDRAAESLAAETGLPDATRKLLGRRLERTRAEIEESAGKRRAELELDQQNATIEAEIDRERGQKIEVDQRLAGLVEQYNTLIDEQRFAEAEVLAKKAAQLSPDSVVARQLLSQSRVIRRLDTQQSLASSKASAILDVVEDTEASSTPFVGPIEFPETRDWEDLTKSRARLAAEGRSRMSPAELQIKERLSTPVEARYRDRPLAEVLDELAKQAQVPLHVDLVGLDSESVGTDTPVTISLDQKISLKSALKLLLEPLHLDYVIRDEVLKITSPQLVRGEVYSVSYPVADLVIPIPNFSPDGIGLNTAIQKGYSLINSTMKVQVGPPPSGILNNSSAASTETTAFPNNVLGQLQAPSLGGGATAATASGTGGGNMADFASLIELIQNTVEPTTWNTVGGPGAISPFNTNLSLVVTQTQEVHEQIADLLDQLRRLQDLQVTIEVRFITLDDAFAERIGVDFDFNIQTGVNSPLNMTAIPNAAGGSTDPFQRGITTAPGGPSQLIGYPLPSLLGGGGLGNNQQGNNQQGNNQQGNNQQGNNQQGNNNLLQNGPTSYPIPFRQNSFALSVPTVPGIPDIATSAATFGFAILSDIEAYFLIQAAQGNTRGNILQAPKVTLFNGQQAFVQDTTQKPFVTSVVPVVGDFAAAQQPVITVLSEGTSVGVQAVISSDRRFVRLTLVPSFSEIGQVQEFQFEGERSTTAKSSDERQGTQADAGGVLPFQPGLTFSTQTAAEQAFNSNGTTLQQPSFHTTSVTTTVSVPDGGTVLMGGIKRMQEGRNEYGVPILSKIPYINRLFKNVGIGRTTQSLMLMVTPRIIIQEEEEDKLLGVERP